MLKIDQLRASWQAAGMSADESNRACRYTNIPPDVVLGCSVDPAIRLQGAFLWGNTPEGHDYWGAMCIRIAESRV